MSKTSQPRYGTATLYRVRRCRVLVGAVLALFLAVAAFAEPRHLLNGDERSYPVSDADRSSLLRSPVR